MTKKQKKKLFNILCALHDGALSDAGRHELARMLEQDAEARRYYLRLNRMFHGLERCYFGACQETVFNGYSVRRARITALFGWSAGIAAALALILLIAPEQVQKPSELLVNRDSTVRISGEDSFVATVVDIADVEWGEANTVEIEGGYLIPGLLDLQRGSLAVILDNGARFSFAAPVRMELKSLQRLFLHSGEVLIDVPGLSAGLEVQTPDAVLKAHTALVSIQRSDGHPTILNVVKGAIDLFTEDAAGREIQERLVIQEAVEIVRGTDQPVTKTSRFIESRMELLQPVAPDNLEYVHYSFDTPRGEFIPNHGNIPNADGRVAGSEYSPEFPAPLQVPGRFGNALEFSGHGEGMLADLKDFGSDEPGSVAFWVKLEPLLNPARYDEIFTWYMYSNPEKAWHEDDVKELVSTIHVNHDPESGVVGAVKIAFRNAWICGSQDLRDGRWHHVTAVFQRTYKGTSIRHYIDGQPARPSAWGETWLTKTRCLDIGGGSISVGRRFWPDRPNELDPSDPCGLRGMIDEFYVFKQPVHPSHASSLHMRNSPNRVLDISFVPRAEPGLAMISMPEVSAQ